MEVISAVDTIISFFQRTDLLSVPDFTVLRKVKQIAMDIEITQ